MVTCKIQRAGSDLILAALLPGAALRTARARCLLLVQLTCCGRGGGHCAVPPAAGDVAKMRRPPHTPHRWVRFDSALGTVVPQREQRCDVPAGGTSTRAMPALLAVPLRMSRNSRQFRSPIAGFRLRFPRPPRSGFLIFTASAAMKLQILTIRSARRWGSCRLRHPPPLHSPRLAHQTEAPEAIHRGSARQIANRIRGTPFIRSSPRWPPSRIRIALLAAFGSSTLIERYRLCARRRGNPGSVPDCTREKNAFIARSRRESAERATRTGMSRHSVSSRRIVVSDLYWS